MMGSVFICFLFFIVQVLPKTTFMPIPISIVGISGTLEVRYNPVTKQFYVDQGDMVYGADFRRRSTSDRMD